MLIETRAFESYIQSLHSGIWLLIHAKGYGYESLEDADRVWFYDYGSSYEKSQKLFAPALRELRKNLIGMEDEKIIFNYRNYLQKNIDDLIEVINSHVIVMPTPASFDDYLNAHNNHQTFGTWENAVYEINNYLKDNIRDEDLMLIKESFLEECNYELKLRGNELSPTKKLSEYQNDIQKIRDKLTTKQQIFLIQKLGIFDLPQIQGLTEQKRGILFGHLLNRNEKNTEDTIRNRFIALPEHHQQPVINLLKELGLEKD